LPAPFRATGWKSSPEPSVKCPAKDTATCGKTKNRPSAAPALRRSGRPTTSRSGKSVSLRTPVRSCALAPESPRSPLAPWEPGQAFRPAVTRILDPRTPTGGRGSSRSKSESCLGLGAGEPACRVRAVYIWSGEKPTTSWRPEEGSPPVEVFEGPL